MTRVKKVGAVARSTKAASVSRRNRASDDRTATQNRVLTDAERLAEFRKSFYQSVLPDLPPIPGYHTCWLTTTNPRDPIHARIRLGYEPILATDIPGWKFAQIRSGDYEGAIGVNEMIAFKLPLELYEAFMYEAHHVQPLAEEQKLSTEQVEELIETAARQARSGDEGIRVIKEQGNEGLGRDRDVGSFEDSLVGTRPG